MNKMLIFIVTALAFSQFAKADNQCSPAICTILENSTLGNCNIDGYGNKLEAKTSVAVESSATGRVQTFDGQPLDCGAKLPDAIDTNQYKKAVILAEKLIAAGACITVVDQIANP